MNTEPVHIGFDNIISINRALVMLSPKQQPTKRMIQEAKNSGMLIDATHARKARAAIVLDTGHIVLAAISPEAISGRLSDMRREIDLKPAADEGEK